MAGKAAAKKSTFVIIGGKLLFYAKEGKFVYVKLSRVLLQCTKKERPDGLSSS
ncbi:hypothetical protein [Bacillus sp. ISL-55]|uniref:hypothetical protein n=1 Tax=Bacillus sp. ISL-55 TaxID=2819134 RepID=UPI001BE630F2|nr:hypothetical protein [Bacillus sp. ISL-55]MBT2693293.1 hypothetical protein [Bacillus sp. ISL-55]